MLLPTPSIFSGVLPSTVLKQGKASCVGWTFKNVHELLFVSYFFFQHVARTKSHIIPSNQGRGIGEVREGVNSEKRSNMRRKIQKALEDKTLASRLRNTCVRLYDHKAMVAILLLKLRKRWWEILIIKCCVRFIGSSFLIIPVSFQFLELTTYRKFWNRWSCIWRGRKAGQWTME